MNKSESKVPNWVVYPEEHLKELYNRELFPFARKDCSDDIACWEEGQENRVFIIHDFSSPGWERRNVFENFH